MRFSPFLRGGSRAVVVRERIAGSGQGRFTGRLSSEQPPHHSSGGSPRAPRDGRRLSPKVVRVTGMEPGRRARFSAAAPPAWRSGRTTRSLLDRVVNGPPAAPHRSQGCENRAPSRAGPGATKGEAMPQVLSRRSTRMRMSAVAYEMAQRPNAKLIVRCTEM